MFVKSDFADNFQKHGVTWEILGRDSDHLAASVASDTAYVPEDFTRQQELVLGDLRSFLISSLRQTFLRCYRYPWLIPYTAGLKDCAAPWMADPTFSFHERSSLHCNTRSPGSVHRSIQLCKAVRKVCWNLRNYIVHPTISPSIKHLEQWYSDFSPTNNSTSSCNSSLPVVAQGSFLLFDSGSRSPWSWYFYGPPCLVHHELLALYVSCCMYLTMLVCYWSLSHITQLQPAPYLILHCNFQGTQARFGLEITKWEATVRKLLQIILFSLKSKLIAMKPPRPVNTINLHLTYTGICQNHIARRSWRTF